MLDSNPQTSNPSGLNFKSDCPHESLLQFEPLLPLITKKLLSSPCSGCTSTEQNWLCLECHELGCMGTGESHIVSHHKSTQHHIALDLKQGFPRCYTCDSYVQSPNLGKLAMRLSSVINSPLDLNYSAVDQLEKEFEELGITEPKKKEFTREDLIQGFKDSSFKKIVVLTGAGISVSAGIPDFRSPKTGLYANLEKYGLPYPEAVFDIKYFKTNPSPFYMLAKELFRDEFKPTPAHYFIKMLLQEGLLFINFTQNIDGLEVKAGINTDYLVEAHGHFREAHCTRCQTRAPIKEVHEHIQKGEVYKCECGGYVKPDIVFFREPLPEEFFENFDNMSEADLVIVMGTSLKVFPFAGLLEEVETEVPVVYINRENTSIFRENFLFMEGDIDEQVIGLVKDLGWEDKLANAQE